VDKLTVQGRFDDTDITHVITENLHVVGNPGGALDGVARLSGRLAIDPGVVVKLQGSRIEAERGASHIIAEGTPKDPIRFTAARDDQYGAGGTFDTSNDGTTTPNAGDWGGFMFNPVSSGDLDNVSITYGGGNVPIAGGFDNFNAVEVVQGRLRISNSTLENNAGGQASTNRDGRGGNDSSTVFVRGSQPVLVNNVFRNNTGNAVSINANSLKSDNRPDYGRATGFRDITSKFEFDNATSQFLFTDNFLPFSDNSGPVVRLNRMEGNGTNGMTVRGELLTVESVWDDTDIVHVLRSEITVSEHHTFSGLRLQSNETGSLVVKLTAGAGFTATGDPLDIEDRIGGTVQIIGRPGFPVVLTSLRDDTIGAGFLPNGFPLTDTDGNGGAPAPGDWRSIQFRQYSNDRNAATILEQEPAETHGNEVNNTPTLAQVLGALAPNEKSGDENRRLGFEVHGNISVDASNDVDVYSFSANGQTEIWIDIDRTTDSLDTMVEVVDAIGNVLARSLSNIVAPLDNPTAGDDPSTSLVEYSLTKNASLGGDFYTSNRFDAGMRVVLPGSASAVGTYFIRVRSQPTAGQEANQAFLTQGLSKGHYQLQIRVNQVDDKPGSTVRNAEIRYATNGIEVIGMPGHSPLLGESAEDTTINDARDQAQDLGALLVSDRNTLSVGGNLADGNDVDFYSFTLDYEQLQVISGASDGGKTWATMFDIDYADGMGGPDTTLAVYDSAGQLLWVGRDSDIADDQPNPGPGQGNDLDDLSRGTVGKLDSVRGRRHPANPSRSANAVLCGGFVERTSANRAQSDLSVQRDDTVSALGASQLRAAHRRGSHRVYRVQEQRRSGCSADDSTAAV
ncbi:MAG: hypothetical protein FD138_1742, partial [Planctomycetota bacterium]